MCGVAAASRNTRFQAARYGLTWVGLTPTDRASFAWRLPSFDHLVGCDQQLVRHGEAEHRGGLEVYDQLEFGRWQHRQVRWFRALEDTTGKGRSRANVAKASLISRALLAWTT